MIYADRKRNRGTPCGGVRLPWNVNKKRDGAVVGIHSLPQDTTASLYDAVGITPCWFTPMRRRRSVQGTVVGGAAVRGLPDWNGH